MLRKLKIKANSLGMKFSLFVVYLCTINNLYILMNNTLNISKISILTSGQISHNENFDFGSNFESQLHKLFWKLLYQNGRSNQGNGSETKNWFKILNLIPESENDERHEKNFKSQFLSTFQNGSLWSPMEFQNFLNAQVIKLEGFKLEFQSSNYDLRMMAQLTWVMLNEESKQLTINKPKRIGLYQPVNWWPNAIEGNRQTDCIVACNGPSVDPRCEIVRDISPNDTSIDAYIVGQYAFNSPPPLPNNSDAFRIFFAMESPILSLSLKLNRKNDQIATYWRGSEVQSPYYKWVYYDPRVKRLNQTFNYARGKSKMAAMVMSNCNSHNDRLGYVKELQKYIDVDVYGKCGQFQCEGDSRYGGPCFASIGRRYKFYLAFENCNCRDYITEKLFLNSLGHSIIPVVLGAHPDDYRAAAPQNSYINVEDFDSPKALAKFLVEVAQDEFKYNEYFEWKGTGEFVDSQFFRRVCSMVVDADRNEEKNGNRLGSNVVEWGTELSQANGMCLATGRWYWGRAENSLKIKVIN